MRNLVVANDPAVATKRDSAGMLGRRLSASDVNILKAALLDGETAIAAYHAWRPGFDLDTVSHGQQRLLPLLQQNLTRLGIDDPQIDRFRGIRRYYWVRNLRAMTRVRPLFERLDREGTPFIVLKGAGLVAAYLDDRSLRPMDDIDILVHDEDVPRTVAAMVACGLTAQGHDNRLVLEPRMRRILPGWPFVSDDQNIDLHWRALHLDRRPQADDRLWQAARTTHLDGMPVRILDPADQLLQICAHAAQTFDGAAIQQWAADAALVIRGSTDLSWDRLAEEAGRRRVSVIIAEGLSFLATELEMPVPAGVIARLRAQGPRTERREARLRALPRTTLSAPDRLFLAYQDFRRGDASGLGPGVLRSFPSFARAWTGAAGWWSTSLALLQMLTGHRRDLRALLGRDLRRRPPEPVALPWTGEAIGVAGLSGQEAGLIAGWGLPEPEGRWTIEAEATAAWRVRENDGDLDLLIDGDIFFHGGHRRQRVDIWVNDRPLTALHFDAGKASMFPLRLPVAGDLIGGRPVIFVTFLTRNLHSPAELGASGDQRALGLRLSRLALVRRGAPFIPDAARLPGTGDALGFGTAEVNRNALVSGWASPDPSGTWTLGSEAVVAWRNDAPGRDLTLTSDGYALLAANAPTQEIELWVGGERVAAWRFDVRTASPLPATVTIPARLAGSGGVTFLTFRVREPRSPVAIGISADPRPLGLHVRSLGLTPAAERRQSKVVQRS